MRILSLTTIVATLFTSVLARSSVHVVSNGNAQSTSTTPEVSMNAFSMFYSHMMDTSSRHPLLFQSPNSNEMQQEQEALVDFLPKSSDIFTKKILANLMVLISGVSSPQDILLNHDTSFFVSDDDVNDYAALVQETLEQMDHQDMTVTTYKNQKTEIRQGDLIIPVASRLDEESFEYFKTDFADLDTSLFDINNEVDRMFIHEVEDVRDIYSSDRKYEPSDMRLIEITTLQKLAQGYGLDSKQYKEAHKVLAQLFENFVLPKFQSTFENNYLATFILTPPITTSFKRDLRINNLAAHVDNKVCYKTASACKNGTSHCNGNGQCIEQGNCFSCQCKSSQYVGESCQYINAVADFQLLFWTGVLLIVITASVVGCVYQSGNMVDGGIIMAQSLPKQD